MHKIEYWLELSFPEWFGVTTGFNMWVKFDIWVKGLT